MKKAQIREEVTAAFRQMGFKQKQMRWNGCTLDVVVGGEFRSLRFPAGMSKRAMAFELGRVSGWLEILNERAQAERITAERAAIENMKAAVNGKLNGAHAGAVA